MINVTQIIQDIKEKNFRTYRSAYKDMTFAEIKIINNGNDATYPNQNYAHHDIFVEMFAKLPTQPLRVIELGCHQGYLAATVLKKFDNILSWKGYDIREAALLRSVVEDPRYEGIALEDWFGTKKLPDFDVFVSANTLEHLNLDQFENMFVALDPKPTWMFLEFPIVNWLPNHSSTHVLYISMKTFDRILSDIGYRRMSLLKRGKENKIYITGWVREEALS